MNQPAHPFPHDELPPTQNLGPTPPRRSGSTMPEEILATLPAGLSRTVALQTATGNAALPQGPRYSRKDLHARGGLGEVFLAHDEELPREVALKEIRADRDDDHSRLRFVIEGTITGSLEHPGIVPVYSLGRHDDGRPFYAMRFVRGKTLQQAIADLQSHDFASAAFRQLLQKFVTVCQTMQYTHDRGVIHRDLKPANIMVGDYGETLVVDWGLAKFIGQKEVATTGAPSASALSDSSVTPAETEQGIVLGTPAYMSPEQALGRTNELTTATDIYALGATLYHLLTGQSPLKQPGKLKNNLERVQEGDIAPPRSISGKIPRALEAVCLKAMSLRAADRYASARDLAAELERWLADEPLAVYREPLHIRTGRWLRKHPAIAATGVTSLALILIAAVVISAISSTYSQQLTSAYNKLNLQHGELAFTNKQLTESHQKLNAANGELVQVNANLKVARDEALAREAESNAILDFLEQRILVVARPGGQDGGGGRNVLLREALEVASAYIDKSFESQPVIQIRLHRTLGNSLLMLGESLPARTNFAAAEKLLMKVESKPGSVLSNALDLAATFHQTGELTKAREQLTKLLAECRTLLGEHDPVTLQAMHQLADVYADLGEQTKALELRQRTLAERDTQLGSDHRDTIRSQVSLARSYVDQGKLPEALKLSTEALEKLKESLGVDHPETLAALHTVADLHARQGSSARALELREKLLKDITVALGPDHEETIQAMNGLAQSYVVADRVPDARTLLENAIARSRAKFGDSHLKTLRLERDLGMCLVQARRFPIATTQLEKTLVRARVALGANDRVTIDCMRLLANCYGTQGREQLALELHIEAYERARASLGPPHPYTLDRMFDLAIDYNRFQVYSKVLELRSFILDIQKESPGLGHPETWTTMAAVAQTHLMLREPEEARQLLREVIKHREQYAIGHPDSRENACDLAYALGQLAHAEEQRGNWEQGNDWYRKSQEAFAKASEKFGGLDQFYESVAHYYEMRTVICKKLPEAIADLSFVEKQPPIEQAELLLGRLYHLRQKKELAEAAATAAALEAAQGRGFATTYQAGVAWSLVCGMAKEDEARNTYADKAIRLLDRVKPKAGGGAAFETSIAQAYAFHFNPDLEPVRKRPGFQAILQRLPSMGKDLIWSDQKR